MYVGQEFARCMLNEKSSTLCTSVRGVTNKRDTMGARSCPNSVEETKKENKTKKNSP